MPETRAAPSIFKVEEAPLSGLSMIEASAGTGKTYAIANLYLRLVLEAGLPPESILAVTFTEAATEELRDRVRKRLAEALAACSGAEPVEDAALRALLPRGAEVSGGEAQARKRLSRALCSFDQAAIFTIHGFCMRTLAENAFECGVPFAAEMMEEQASLRDEILADFRRLNYASALRCAALDFCGLDARRMRKFADELLRNHEIALDPSSPTADFKRAEKSFNVAMEIWRGGGREEVEGVLLADSGLSRAKDAYALPRIPLIVSLMDMAASGAPTKAALEEISKLAAGSIRMKRGKPEPERRFFNAAAAFLKDLEGFSVSARLELAAYLRKEMESRKASWNRMYFDDLLLRMRDGLRSPGGGALGEAIRRKYKAAMIDEFQDTDPVQLEIFMRAFRSEGAALLFIGDPKQSIYRFRGADVFSYLKAAKETPPERSFTLAENWRSSTGLVEALNSLFGSCPDPFALGGELEYVKVRAAAESKGNRRGLSIDGKAVEPLNFALVPPGEDGKAPGKGSALETCLGWAVAETAELVRLGVEGRAKLGPDNLKPSDIAILVLRNDDAERLRVMLGALNIPAALQKSGDVFASREASETLSVLEGIASPGDTRKVNAALLTDIVGVGAETLVSMLEEPSRQGEYEEFLESFRRRRREWEEEGFIAMFRRLLVESRTGPRLMERKGGERSLTNILHMEEMLQREASKARLGPERLIAWLGERMRSEGAVREEHEMRLERDDDAVKIVTVHKSKGLEYGVVLCPALWQRGADLDGKDDFKYHKEDGSLVMDIGSDGREEGPLSKARVEELSDLMRVLYVALTRAKNLCAVAWGRINHCEGCSLAHLLREGDLERMSGGGLIGIRHLEGALPAPEFEVRTQAGSRLSAKTFSGQIRHDLGTASFSMISAENDEDLRFDAGSASPPDVCDTGESVRASGIFAFPKGAVAGTCMHRIFERLDFSADAEAVRRTVKAAILEFGLGGNKEDILASRVDALAGMVGNVLGAELLPAAGGFRLADAEPGRKVSELEFHIPSGRISPESLRALFERSPLPGATEDFAKRLGALNFGAVEGFLHGYIDLAFEHGGRHWIVDWKSNHLGNSIDDYNPESLAANMESSLYLLQSCIYAAAWTRHLKVRVPGFDYGRDFGGVLYVYLRGVSKGRPGWGVHFSKPPEAILDGLCGGPR